MSLQAFFYPAHLAIARLTQLVQGIVAGENLNLVEFPEEKGGSADQQLAVPFLAGMDTIEVEEARIVLRAEPRAIAIEDYTVTHNGDSGIFLSLPTPARLKKIEVNYPTPEVGPGEQVRLVVRVATPKGAGFTGGAPLFAFPDFGKPGDMYEPVLGGMTLDTYTGNRRVITLPGVLGSAWLIQLAIGDEPTALSPLPVKPTLTRVTLDAAPRNLSVVLMTDDGEALLWNNPETLFPGAGEQAVSFTPLAQRHLAAALGKATGSEVTLPVPLKFRSDSGGAILITASRLQSEYLVWPCGESPLILRLGGDLTPLVLSAPALLRPKSSSMRLVAKLLGRELNGASPEPPLQPPTAGLRLGLERSVAAATDVAPLTGKAPGSRLDLASARVFVAAREDSELVREVRSDVAGVPGPVAAPPVVRQVKKDFSGWLEFELTRPLAVVTGQAPLWLSLRSNKGEVFWFASGSRSGNSRISTDRGETWGAPDPALAPAGDLLVQLFQVLQDPLPAPVIRLQNGATILKNNLFASPVKKSDREYLLENATLPNEVHAFLASRPGQGRVKSPLQLFSPSVLDLTVHSMAITYDPFQGIVEPPNLP
jgi:hypothetical protein